MALFILVVFLLLMSSGLPIGFVLGLTGLFGFYKLGDPALLTILPQIFFSTMDSFVLLALPFFLLVGDVMNKMGLTGRIISFSDIFFGRLRGALAQVNIVTSIIFGGISGASTVDMVTLGKIFIPSMTKEGYDKDFSTAVTLASAMISPIIPPSIIMVIYGAQTGVSIGGLFAAGIVPGLMIGAGLMILTRIISEKRNYPRHMEKVTIRRLFSVTKKASLALLMPVIILGGILGGYFTPTEAAAVAAGYAVFLGLVVYRNLSLRDLYWLLFNSCVMMGVFALIMSSASLLSWILASEQIPQMVARLLVSISSNKYVILLLIILFLLFMGMFLDIIPAIIILSPVLAPVAISAGIHPLHFAIVMCVALVIGLMTPPFGATLFMSMIVSGLNIDQVVKALWPFLVVEIFVLFLVAYIPVLTMFIPKLLGFIY